MLKAIDWLLTKIYFFTNKEVVQSIVTKDQSIGYGFLSRPINLMVLLEFEEVEIFHRPIDWSLVTIDCITSLFVKKQFFSKANRLTFNINRLFLLLFFENGLENITNQLGSLTNRLAHTFCLLSCFLNISKCIASTTNHLSVCMH